MDNLDKVKPVWIFNEARDEKLTFVKNFQAMRLLCGRRDSYTTTTRRMMKFLSFCVYCIKREQARILHWIIMMMMMMMLLIGL